VSYDALVIAAPPDDSERQMGGTLALLVDAGQRIVLVNLMAGEPAEFAEPRVHARQTAEAAAILVSTSSPCPGRTAWSLTHSTCACCIAG
jgi:LmbE family N-acetylglucosaminyl deacetylase